jgi:hypothetical protein
MPRTEEISPIPTTQREPPRRLGSIGRGDVGWHGGRAMPGTQISAPVAQDVRRLWPKEQHG